MTGDQTVQCYIVSNLMYAMTEAGTDGKSKLVTFPGNYKLPEMHWQGFVSDITKDQVDGLTKYYNSIGKKQIGWYIQSKAALSAKSPLYIEYHIVGETFTRKEYINQGGIFTFTWQRPYGATDCKTSGNFWYSNGSCGNRGIAFLLGFYVHY